MHSAYSSAIVFRRSNAPREDPFGVTCTPRVLNVSVGEMHFISSGLLVLCPEVNDSVPGDSCGVESIAFPFFQDHESNYQNHLDRFRAPLVLNNRRSHSCPSFCKP
jgi:hypothetical protein